MCTCDPNNTTEEYHTAHSDFEISSPEEWRTSTQYHEEDIEPEYRATPRRIIRDFRRGVSRMSALRTTRRRDLTTGVAIVPRRIDFDAVSQIEDFNSREDLEEIPRETLQRLKNAEKREAIPRTYRLSRIRRPQFPEYKKQYLPRMTRMTPCGKCLRI